MADNKNLIQRAAIALGYTLQLKGTNPAISSNGSAGAGPWSFLDNLLPGSSIDYGREAGELHKNSIVLPCISWQMRTFPEAPVIVQTMDAQGNEKTVPKHPLPALLRRPNAHYSGRLMWGATCLSLVVDGNSYWYKVRSGAGKVVELWWVPHFMLNPMWEGDDFITCYVYSINGKQYKIPASDIVHFREGIDPHNDRKGLSPLSACLREVCTDNEAGNFSAAIMRNMGVPGVIISPKEQPRGATGSGSTAFDEAKGKKLVMLWNEKFRGDRRGEPFINPFPLDVQAPGLSPEQLVLDTLRKVPEERITAALGIPAIVAGMGAGLARSTFANFKEAREAAYESSIIPSQCLRAEELEVQLLGDIGMGDPERETVSFDLRKVRALQDDQNDLHKRVVMDFKGGIIKRNQALVALGYPEDPAEGDIYAPLGPGAPGATAAPAPDGQDTPPAKSIRKKSDDGEHWVTVNGRRVCFGADGKPAEEKPSKKAERALESHNPCTKEKQDLGTQSERDVVEAIDGKGTPNNSPMDVTRVQGNRQIGIEVKTLCDSKADRIIVRKECRERKEEWAKQKGNEAHTVAFDRRDKYQDGAHAAKYSGHEIYYRRGVGAFSLSKMYKAESMAEVQKLIDMPADKLPKNAKEFSL